MRCMACGEEMVLTAVVPDDTMEVKGYEHQTLQCFACRGTERRLVFGRGATVSTTPPPVSSCSQPDGSAPGRAWARAVEKLRSRQADLHQRADEVKKTNWNIQFNQEWEKLAPTRREPPPAGNSSNGRPKDLARKSGRALRAQLLRKRSPAPGRNETAQPAIEPTSEAVQRFNHFWESLVPARSLPDPPAEVSVPSALPAPLPRSLSLVPLEALEAMCAASRAILLLRGTQHMGS
jgi:hypothetical protein